MLQEAQRTSAPSALSVSISTAVWMVMCSEPQMRAPRNGCSGPYSSRIAMRPGISVSAMAISLRPHSARLKSLTTQSVAGWAVAALLAAFDAALMSVLAGWKWDAPAGTPVGAAYSRAYHLLQRRHKDFFMSLTGGNGGRAEPPVSARRGPQGAADAEQAMREKTQLDLELPPAINSLSELAKAENECRRCPLYKDATQAVPGEGRKSAHVMLVGEQPGDKEDLAGKPFVGPAGRVLDRALA